MDVTARDKIWVVLQRIDGSFTVTGVREKLEGEFDSVPSDETIRRVLRAGTELGVVEHGLGSPTYRVVSEPKYRVQVVEGSLSAGEKAELRDLIVNETRVNA